MFKDGRVAYINRSLFLLMVCLFSVFDKEQAITRTIFEPNKRGEGGGSDLFWKDPTDFVYIEFPRYSCIFNDVRDLDTVVKFCVWLY